MKQFGTVVHCGPWVVRIEYQKLLLEKKVTFWACKKCELFLHLDWENEDGFWNRSKKALLVYTQHLGTISAFLCTYILISFGRRNFLTACIRVDTRVSFVQSFREFHAKRVSYFVKNASCFAKLALACEAESQFRMLRISRSEKFNKRSETAMSNKKALFLGFLWFLAISTDY